MTKSHRLGLPFLVAGQAQKEITHNEALLLLDAVSHACCAAAPANDPPEEAEIGMAYLCGSAPTGAWVGHPGALAYWSDSGWRFVAPFDGLQAIDRSSGQTWHYTSGEWQIGIVEAREVRVDGLRVIGSRQPAISNASGGATIDGEARSALSQVLIALRAHGLIAS